MIIVLSYWLYVLSLISCINAAPTVDPPCSENVTGAYLDIVVVIDTSTAMSAASLSKISTTLLLVLSKFQIGNQANLLQLQRNTRLAVVTYDQQATIQADYSAINSLTDLSTVLAKISTSNSQTANLTDGLTNAFTVRQPTLFDPKTAQRPTAFVIFSATSNGIDDNQVSQLLFNHDTSITLITVNFNTGDSVLTGLLNNITYNSAVNASMYNLAGSDTALAAKLQWSLSQANCYCGYYTFYNQGTNVIYWDATNNRYARYAECLEYAPWGNGDVPLDSPTLILRVKTNKKVPATILSAQKQKFVQSLYLGSNSWTFNQSFPFYIGLHKNVQGQYSWYDYDLSEFPLTGYTNWGSGQPNATGGDCAIYDSTDNTTLAWKSYDCNVHRGLQSADHSVVPNGLAQSPACDASSLACCIGCGVVG